MCCLPKRADLDAARKAFLKNEPRDLFYRVATDLVRLSIEGASELSLAEALAVLLQTWNASYYRYRRFDSAHFDNLEQLLKTYRERLTKLRALRIQGYDPGPDTAALFEAFEALLGPVGAAKALHLLCPQLFPLWDRGITNAYKLSLGTSGSNGHRYCRFMAICKQQIAHLSRDGSCGDDVLKRLDEFNYCRYTKKWI